MLDSQGIERLRSYQGRGAPVLSVYLGTRRKQGEAASIGQRLRDLLTPIRSRAEELDRAEARALLDAVDTVSRHEDRLSREPLAGVAVFVSGDGLDEYQALPVPFRDRAIVAEHPYLRPLDAMLTGSMRYCAVVLDRREAHIMRFFMEDLESTEVLSEEELRKANYGGFSGYDEHRVRRRADQVAQRHYRGIAARLFALYKEGGFEVLVLGGQQENVDGLRRELHSDVAGVLAGTFPLDTHTMTPAIVREASKVLRDEHDRSQQRALVDQLVDLAKGGGLAVLGLAEVLAAANHKAIEVVAVDTQSSVPGWECSSCGWLLDEAREGGCVACGEALHNVPDLIDAVVRAVVGASGSVKHILDETPLAEYRVGALLRFRPTPA